MQSKKLDRAKQFMPFAALRGYYDMISSCEKIREPKRDFSEEERELIDNKISKIKKGMIVKVKYYNIDSYEEMIGMVSEFDETFCTMSVIKTKINFNDISDIEVIS